MRPRTPLCTLQHCSYPENTMSNDLDFLYKSLYLSLEQEYERYQELFEAIQKEANLLISGDSKDIIDFNSKNERLLLSAGMASEIRLDAINKITSCLHLEEPLTMGQLIAYAPANIRQTLIEYKEKFADMILKIQKTNNRNRDVIAVSISHINNTINYIDSLTCTNPNYDRHGQIRAGNLQSRLISEEG
jgi:flagellar biosynthesis/type III secretory pathway chaperone